MKKFILGVIVGGLIFGSVPLAAAIEEYICYKADYKVVINGKTYEDAELPILSYKGNTYAPLRSMLSAAGLNVNWNTELGQAEVGNVSNKAKAENNTNNQTIQIPNTQTIFIPYTETEQNAHGIFIPYTELELKGEALKSYWQLEKQKREQEQNQ